MQVQVDRETAGRLGVSMQAINDTLNDAFGQRQISTIYSQANQYRVILEAQPRYQQDPAALAKLYVTGASTSTGTAAVVANTAAGTTNTNTSATPNTITGSNQVPLSTFARFEHISAPLMLAHQEQFPSVTISFNLPRGSALSDAVAAITAGAARHRDAVVGDRLVFRRLRRVRQVAGRPAVADPRRGGDDLHRARRAVREPDPSVHHPRRRCRRPASARCWR